MSDLDPEALEAAYEAYERACPYDIFYPAVEAAIRAWEVHKEPMSPAVAKTMVELEQRLAARVVKDLRDVAENLKVPVPNNAEGYVYYAEAVVVLRAANLLERLAGLHPHDQEQHQAEGSTTADRDQQQD